MIVLCHIEVAQRQYLCGDGGTVSFLLSGHGGFGDCLVGFIHVVDAGTVLAPPVISLPIYAGGIHHLEKAIQQLIR